MVASVEPEQNWKNWDVPMPQDVSDLEQRQSVRVGKIEQMERIQGEKGSDTESSSPSRTANESRFAREVGVEEVEENNAGGGQRP